MTNLLEQVRDALAPRYDVDRILGQGGMGTVFLAQDTRLGCPVAVKVLPPQLAGEAARLRFLREARLLAALKHPHIVAIHDVDERDEFAFYVMDHLADETLAHHLLRGPLTPPEALKVGRDVLDALERVHEAGVVHRDIKPANIFLVDGRAVLTDFGIAKVREPEAETLTAPHQQPHTPGYAAPEQRAGLDVDARADLYAVGLTLFECYAGLRSTLEAGIDPSWRLVPKPVRRVLRRALEPDPDRRWPDARTFRHQLWHTRVRSYALRAAALAAATAAVGLAVGVSIRSRTAAPAASWTVAVSGASAPVLDSIAAVLERGFRASIAYVCGPGDCPLFPYEFSLSGRLEDDRLEADLQGRDRQSGELVLAPAVIGTASGWTVIADSLLRAALPILWAERSAVRDWVPWQVLPSGTSGLEALARAEVHLAAGRWSDALRAYHRAVQIDDTCILCSWRITEVERWHVRPPSAEHIERAIAAVDAFPEPFRPLIISQSLSLQQRLDTLVWAAQRWRAFHPASFLLGAELFHRGPLLGFRRGEAEEWLINATDLYPEFAPTWEMLAWIRIADGRRAQADSALGALTSADRAPSVDALAASMRALLDAAYAYRFTPETAGEVVDSVLRSSVGDSPDVAVGPRLLLAFEVPAGAVAVGTRLAASGNQAFARSGWIARMLGFFAQGRLDSALAAGRDARTRGHDVPAVRSLGIRLWAAWALLDSAAAPAVDPQLTDALRLAADGAAGPDPAARSAAWLLALLEARGAASPTVSPSAGVDDPALLDILRADSLARAGRADLALDILEGRIINQTATRVSGFTEIDNMPDIFFRTLLNGMAAEWYDGLGREHEALARLRWHEHYDQRILPIANPTVQDIDWAFGTLARWKRAVRLDSLGQHLEACQSYAAVARNWVLGDSVFAQRARDAAERRRALACAE